MPERDRSSLCAQPGRGWDVACTSCILQAVVMLGCPTQTRVKLSFLQTRLGKGGRSGRRPALTLACVDLRPRKVRAEVGSRMQGFSVT